MLAILIALLAILTSAIAYCMFSKQKQGNVNELITTVEGFQRSITIVSSKTFAQKYEKIGNNSFYVLCSMQGRSYYGKLVLKINPPLKKNNYIVVSVRSSIGTVSLTLSYSRKMYDAETGVSLYPNWLNIQVANYLNNTYRLTGVNETPPKKPLDMVFNMSRSKITILNNDSGEGLIIYTDINKTLEMYTNRSEIINLGYESLVIVYGDTFAAYLTVSNIVKPVPIVDTLRVELAYPKEWVNETPWINVSIERVG